MEESRSKIGSHEEDNETESSWEQEGYLGLEETEEEEEWDMFEEEEGEELEQPEELTASYSELATEERVRSQETEGQSSNSGPAIRIARSTRVRQELIAIHQTRTPRGRRQRRKKNKAAGNSASNTFHHKIISFGVRGRSIARLIPL